MALQRPPLLLRIIFRWRQVEELSQGPESEHRCWNSAAVNLSPSKASALPCGLPSKGGGPLWLPLRVLRPGWGPGSHLRPSLCCEPQLPTSAVGARWELPLVRVVGVPSPGAGFHKELGSVDSQCHGWRTPIRGPLKP